MIMFYANKQKLYERLILSNLKLVYLYAIVEKKILE